MTLWLAVTPLADRPDGPVTASAVLGLVGVLIGALIAGGFNYAVSFVDRRFRTQLQAAYDLQEAVLTLRTVARRWGAELAHTPESQLDLDVAIQRAEVTTDRLRCEVVRTRAITWIEQAPLLLDDRQAPEHVEQRLWDDLRAALQEEIKHYG